MKYGDVLRYPIAEDPSEDWLFMYVSARSVMRQRSSTGRWHRHVESINVLVLRAHPADDLWTPGVSVVSAGVNELEIA